MDTHRSPLLKLLSSKYGTAISVIVLVVTLNSTLLFFSQLLQQSTSRSYHHGEGRSFMGVNIDSHAEQDQVSYGNPSEALSSAFSSITAFFEDNIAATPSTDSLCSPPIDIVYTWVNGSDPKHSLALLKTKLAKLSRENGTEITVCEPNQDPVEHNCYKYEETASRFQDNQELKYSLRSVWKYAPWVRNIYLVTNGQIPSWLNIHHPRIHIVTHSAIFPNSSHLPTFASPAIEVHLHRIPGLSEHFLYLNDDILFGRDLYPSDWYTVGKGQRVYLAWPIPDCDDGCPGSWVADGYCDLPCNTSACAFDGGDCANVTYTPSMSAGQYGYYGYNDQPASYCSGGCLDTWIGDKYCDRTCRNPECGFDAGDCGFDLVFQNQIGFSLSPSMVATSDPLPKAIQVGTLLNGDDIPYSTVIYFNLSQVITAEDTITEAAYSNNNIVRLATVSPKNKVLMIYLLSEPKTPIAASNTSSNGTETSVDPPNQIIVSFTTKKEGSMETVDHFFVLFINKYSLSHSTQEQSPSANTTTVTTTTRELLHLESTSDVFWAYGNPQLKKKLTSRNAYSSKTIENQKKLVQKAGSDGIDFMHGEIFPWEDKQARSTIQSSLIDRDDKYVEDFYESSETTISTTRKLKDYYGDSLKYVNRLMNEAFGPDSRKAPAHMPAYLQKSILDRMQKKWPKQFDETSSHQFRAPNDMQYFFTYFYFYMHERIPYNFTQVFYHDLDTDGDGILNYNEIRTVAATLARSTAAHPPPPRGSSYSGYTNSAWSTWAGMNLGDPPDEPELQWLEFCDSAWLAWNPALANIIPEVPVAPPVATNISEIAASTKQTLLEVDQSNSYNYFGTYEGPVTNTSTMLYRANLSKLPRNFTLTYTLLKNCSAAMKPLQLHYKARLRNKYELGDMEEVAFVMVPTNRTKALHSLDGIRHKRNKFICLNDNMNHTDPHSVEVVEAMHDLFTALYPYPSPFELPEGQTNKYLHTDDLLAARSDIRYKKGQIVAMILILSLVLVAAIRCCSKRRQNEPQRSVLGKLKSHDV